MRTLWHDLCQQELGVDLEIVTTTWDQIPDLRPPNTSEASVSTFMKLPIGPRLVLAFDRGRTIEDVLMTHEIGHQVLHLQNFEVLLDTKKTHSFEETCVNSMAHHPALYALQRSLGHDPQAMIDNRVEHLIREFSKRRELAEDPALVLGTVIADDLFSCSQSQRERLLRSAQLMRPKAYKIAKKFFEAARRHDPARIETHGQYLEAIRNCTGHIQHWKRTNQKTVMRQQVQGWT